MTAVQHLQPPESLFLRGESLQAGKFILISLLIWVGCKKSVDPPDDEVRTPRNFTWTRDTLGDGTYQSLLSGLWGSSPTNVYAVGHSSTTWQGQIWRYNGNQWSDVSYGYVQAFQELQGFYFAPVQVIGFALNDIWIVGYRDTSFVSQPVKKGFILHYSGNDPWDGYWLPTANNHFSVGGISSSDLWVGGLNGQMFHFNGTDWQENSLNDSISVLFIRAIASNKVYASGWLPTQGTTLIKYFEWNGSQWNLIESRFDYEPLPGFQPWFDVIDGAIVSANGPHVVKRTGPGSWQEIYNASQSSIVFVGAFSNNAFAIGRTFTNSEAAFHFDGNTWEKIQSLNSTNGVISRVWSFENETFMAGREESPTNTMFPRSFVIRGK